jgi:hypothetical protein
MEAQGWYAAGYGPTAGYTPIPGGPASPAVGPFVKPLVPQTTKTYGGYAPILVNPTAAVAPPPMPPIIDFMLPQAQGKKHGK